MRGESGVPGEGEVVGVPMFHSLVVHHAINKYQLRLDVQLILWPTYLYYLHGSFISPQQETSKAS